jgi:hypothetical protein
VFDSLQDILSRAISYSTLLVERAVVGLIRLCSALVDEVSEYGCRAVLLLSMLGRHA